ncbi:uncharacterized protein AB675_4458 [Cyphellophora attinorum]|uniref:Uncharacterized protein n=1 Tax=Cyphellophora attinorum TaxID=1664694 RepID=A0A0N1H2R8_9EURO|nr:uncharacterized protein AB675_4458 [Phialophora attinorum]KPI39050.1 hypothetical protein AB675_4458 [Phialophora attinorum]
MPSGDSMHGSSMRNSQRDSPRSIQARRRVTPASAPARSPRLSQSRASPQVSSKSAAADYAFDYAAAVVGYFVDVVFSALKLLKTPISWIIAAYLLAGVLTLLRNFLTNSIYTAMTPICRLPFAPTLIPICSYQSNFPGPDGQHHPTIDASSSAPDPEFSSLMSAQNKLTGILDDTTASLSLPLSMKRSEVSIRDLRQIVRFSSLNSRHELVLEFDGFIETARAASFDLQKFNSHVGRAVDVTLSTARWTERILDDMAQKNREASNTLVPRFVKNLMTPFTPVPFTKSRLLDQYLVHTNLISEEIAKLIDEAQALLLVLQSLEDRLEVIHSISFSSSQNAQVSKDEILSHLWTMVGGNRAQLSKYNKHLRLLSQVGEYRTAAFAHVSGTILKLQAMGAELEELRTRVDAAGLEKQVRKEVSLEVHLESIRLGVERLEDGRAKAREVEKGYTRRVLDVSEQGQLEVDEKRLGRTLDDDLYDYDALG